MIKRLTYRITFGFLFLLTGPLCAQKNEISLLFIGDVMQHKDQITSAYNPKSGKYEYQTFKHVKDLISGVDIAIANLEFTMAGPPYSGYPQFCAPDEIAVALKDAGVDVLVTANNHSCDKRQKGIIRTIDVLDSLAIKHTGTFKSINHKKETFPLILQKNGFRIALLNYTYGTNGIPIPKGTVVNLIDRETIKNDLLLAKSYHVDNIIIFMHWGLEYQRNPSKTQSDLADYCLKNGADFVIGSHPHVLQKMENSYSKTSNKDELVVYSLGNFVSHQRSRHRDGGAMFELRLSKKYDRTWIESAGYYLTWVYNPQFESGEEFYVLPASQFEHDQSFLDDFSYRKMLTFIKDSRDLFKRQNVNVHEIKYDLKSGFWAF